MSYIVNLDDFKPMFMDCVNKLDSEVGFSLYVNPEDLSDVKLQASIGSDKKAIIYYNSNIFIIFENFRVKHTSNSLHYHITEDYCKLTLEPILVRTCEHLARKDYVYDETVPKLNGWLKFIKDITDIKIPQHGIKVYVISFNFYRNMHKDDYKKLALLEIFEKPIQERTM